MLESFEINNFRQFDHFKLPNCNKINIFLGENNVGKTTILETIFMIGCGFNILPMLNQSVFRFNRPTSTYDYIEKLLAAFKGGNAESLIIEFKAKYNGKNISMSHRLKPSNLFDNLKPTIVGKPHIEDSRDTKQTGIFESNNSPIPNQIIAEWESNELKNKGNGKKKTATLSFPIDDISLNGDNNFYARYIDILAHRNQNINASIYSSLKRGDMFGEFKNQLCKIFKEIDDIESIPYPDGHSAPVYIRKRNSELLPLYAFGDGLQRYYHILGSLMGSSNAILCIEEIDVTFHPSAQKQLGKNLMYYSNKYNGQLFMTTHNLEFVDNFLEGVIESNEADMLDLVSVHTLRRDVNDNHTRVRTYNGKEALKVRKEFNLELR